MQTTATFWDDRAQKYNEEIQRHDSLYTRTIDSTKSLLSDSDVVLDFGCGSGELGLDIAFHVRQVRGIDTSDKMIELADHKIRDRQVCNATFSQTGVFDPRLQDGSFSAVTAFNILHLMDDVPRALARLHHLLKSGGLLISQTPCLTERKWFVRAFIGLAQVLGFSPPIRSLTFAELESLVSSSGFEILQSEIWDEKDAVQRIVARKPDGVREHSDAAEAQSRPKPEESGDRGT